MFRLSCNHRQRSDLEIEIELGRSWEAWPQHAQGESGASLQVEETNKEASFQRQAAAVVGGPRNKECAFWSWRFQSA